ncbi:MAG TPA: hypothetical protein VNJ01_13795, partial [Bacteriovoracaceae bacterium]|nr:hypothetical protein [Bacteriovoracaceae bacterium]
MNAVRLLKFIGLLAFSANAMGADSLSYSGRLVNANGSPVTGPVGLQFNLSYTDDPTVVICSKTLTGVALTNGVFHTKLDFTLADCGGTLTLVKVLSAIPAGESIAVQVTDTTNNKAYAFQAIHSIPSSITANVAKTLEQMGATSGQVLKWDGTKWAPAAAGGGGAGTVTEVRSGSGMSPVTINSTNPSGTVGIAPKGVVGTLIGDSAITDIKVSSVAAIARSKLANGNPSTVVINDGAGVMSDIAVVPLTLGGTGSNTALGARSNLGLGTAAVA